MIILDNNYDDDNKYKFTHAYLQIFSSKIINNYKYYRFIDE